MIVEIVQITELQFAKTHFYSVLIFGNQYSEFNDFQKRMQGNWKDKKQLGEINRLIQQIGELYGAQDQYFTREGYAERLPHPTYRFIDSDGETDYGLRLYCIRITEKIVILLNGARKTTQNPQNCPNCKPHFLFANKLSDALYAALQNDEIEYNEFDILMNEDFELIIT